jgi:hypothetical protein
MGCGGTASSQPATTQPVATKQPVTASGSGTTAGTNVRLPAIFKILPRDRLSPAAVYAPAHIPIELVLISRDGRAHRAVLHTPKPQRLTVAAGGRAEKLLPGLPAGTYRLDVDGRTRGALHVGVGPGP